MSHDHVSTRATGPLLGVFALVAAFAVVEVVTGVITGSLALTADAGHMATDAIGIGMALAAAVAAGRSAPTAHHTYGVYRFEIIAALANAVLLLGVAAYVVVEAIARFGSSTTVRPGPMLVVGILGLVVNVVAFVILRSSAEGSLNVEGAYLEVLGDLLASIGVVVAAFIIATTGWAWVDGVTGIAIGAYIVPRALGLARRAIRILSEGAPDHVDVDAMVAELQALDGVAGIHDLHVWTLTSGMHAATAHIVVVDDADAHRVLDAAQALTRTAFEIDHGTFQIEPSSHTGCSEATW